VIRENGMPNSGCVPKHVRFKMESAHGQDFGTDTDPTLPNVSA
jgi:hypothetical protein